MSKDRILDMHLGHELPLTEAEDVMGRHNLVEGILKRVGVGSTVM